MPDDAIPPDEAQQWDVFICYRRDDGWDTAVWLHDHLQGKPLPSATTLAPCIRFYFDIHTPSVDDWRKLNRRALEKARAMIVVCTPGSAVDMGPEDEVQREIRWWIDERKTAPILIDAVGKGTRWVPKSIRDRWPNAQLVTVCLPDLAKEDAAERGKLEQHAVSRITQGIHLSESQVRDEELAEAVRLRKELEVALAEAKRQGNIASAALLAAQGELLIEEGKLSSAQCGARLVVDSLQHVPTLQGHRAWAKALSFFPPQQDAASFPAANGVEAISIGGGGRFVAAGCKDRTVVVDVELQSSYWFSHRGAVRAVALDPTGKYLATRAEGETVRIWGLDFKELLHEWPNNGSAVSLRFGNAGRLLASCDHSESKEIRLWDYSSRHEDPLLRSFELVYRVGAFSRNDEYLAALVDHGQLNEDVVVCWTLTGRKRGQQLGGYLHAGGLIGVTFNPDDSLIATSGFDYLAEVRPFVREGISSPTYATRLYGGTGRAVAFDPNGSHVAIAGEDRVRLWDFRSEREVATIAHPDVKTLAFDATGETLTTVASQEVRRWAVGSGGKLARAIQQTKKPLNAEEVIAMVPALSDRIGRELTDAERAEYLP